MIFTALLELLVQCVKLLTFGGAEVGTTMTTAGSGVKGMEHLMDFSNKMSPLGNANADECADYCVMMFSDFTRKVTMQNLYHDGGFSSMGMSLRAMNQYSKGLEEYTDENGHIIYG